VPISINKNSSSSSSSFHHFWLAPLRAKFHQSSRSKTCVAPLTVNSLQSPDPKAVGSEPRTW